MTEGNDRAKKERNQQKAGLSPLKQMCLLLSIIIVTGLVPLNGRIQGILFIDEMFFLDGARTLVEKRSLSVESANVFVEGRAGQFCVPGPNNRLYSQNPIGFSIILAPIYALGGWQQVFHTNLFLFPIIIVLLYLLFRKWFNSGISLTGVFLFAISPVFAYFSTLVMTHSLALMIQIVALLLMLSPTRIPSKLRYALGGLISGLGLLIRLDAILMLIPLVFVALFPLSEPPCSICREWRRRITILIVALAGFGIGAAPHFLYQKMTFGSGLRSGYHVHLAVSHPLSFDRIPTNFPRVFNKLQSTAMPLTASIGLIGFLYLIVTRRHAAIHIGTWGFPFFLFYLAFCAGPKYPFNLRYFIPLFPALAVSAAALMHDIISHRCIRNANYHRVRMILAMLLIAACAIANLHLGCNMVASRNKIILKQRKLIHQVEVLLPLGATVFVPHHEALMMELMRCNFDIRDSDYLWGGNIPLPGVKGGRDTRNRDHKKLTRLPKDQLQRTISGLLPRLLQEKRVIYVVCSDVNATFLNQNYPVNTIRIATSDLPSDVPGGIFRIDPGSSASDFSPFHDLARR